MRSSMRELEPREKKAVDSAGGRAGGQRRGAHVRVLARWIGRCRKWRLDAIRPSDGAAPGAGARNRRHGSRQAGNSQESHGRSCRLARKSLIRAETAQQAQAQVITILRGLGAAEAPPIEIRADGTGRHRALRRRLRRGERLHSGRVPHRAAAQFPGCAGRAPGADRHARSARDRRQSEGEDVERPHHRGRHRAENSGCRKRRERSSS